MNDLDLRVPPKSDDISEPHIRALVCRTCKKIDELPDFQGPPEYDTLLEISVARHKDHKGQLYRIPLKYWMIPKIKAECIKQISNGSTGLDVVGTNFYDSRSTFSEDALKCFSQHGRPEGNCPDWKAKNKELLPPTKGDRKEVGLSIKDAPKIHLCNFCPVAVFMEHQIREAAKAYD